MSDDRSTSDRGPTHTVCETSKDGADCSVGREKEKRWQLNANESGDCIRRDDRIGEGSVQRVRGAQG